MSALSDTGVPSPADPARLLVVEDDAIVAHDVEGSLQEMGYEVCGVISRGEWALKAVRDKQPDLVLMDVRLAGSVDGVEAGRAILEEGVPVVYLTAYADDETRSRVRETSPFGYVVKPFTDRDLQSAVEVALLRHRMERRLQESERRFRQMAESIEEVFWLRDPANEEMLYVSPAFEEIWGRPVEKLYEHPRLWMESIHPDDRERIAGTVLEERDPGFEEEYRVVRPDGEVRWIRDQAFPVTDDDGELRRVAGVARDVTEQREARRESERQRRKLSRILDTAADGILLTDEEGRFEYANPAAEEILGLERSEIGERTYRDSAWEIRGPDGGPFPEERLPVAQVLRNREPVREIEHSVVRPDGSRIVLRVNANPLRDADGELTGVVASIRDVTEQRRFEAQLEERALHDYLTGLPNRALFRDRLEHAVERVERHGGVVAVLFVDLKRFKVVNDSLGHEAGDRVLKEVARRLEGAVRDEDTVARIGGDEFTVLLEQVDDETGAVRVAKRLAGVFQEPILVGGQEISMEASIGVSLHQGGEGSEATGGDLLPRADAAMYRAKELPGTRYALADRSLDTTGPTRLREETRLRRALSDDRMRTVYQPIFSLETGEVRGVEALARWHDPELGQVPPSKFIPLAEETGLIVALGEQQLKRACLKFGNGPDSSGASGDAGLRLHVNLSARQLEDPELVARLERILEETGFPPPLLYLEITESAAVREAERVEDLKRVGVKLAIDDFGTQYSTLSQLRHLRTDTLKIDRTFVAGLPESDRDRAIVETVLTLGRSLGVGVVAEGIETAAQAEMLRELGCDEAQGYQLARPMPADELGELRRLSDEG